MQIQMDKDLKYVFDVLPSFGTRYSSLVMGYVSLFGVTPFNIKTKKLRVLLEEMKRLFDAQSFSFQQKQYPISHAGIGEALDICIKKNFTERLENHNYLKKIMIGISEREGKEKSRMSEKELRTREQKQAAGYDREENPSRSPFVKGGRQVSDEEARANLARVGNIIKSIGG